MQHGIIKGIKHYVYDDVEEFRKYHEEEIVENWRDGKDGDWVLANDGGIVQVLKAGVLRGSRSKKFRNRPGYVRTIVGTFLVRNDAFMDTDFSQHPGRYSFSKKIVCPNENVFKRKYVTRKERVFAVNVAVGMGPVRAYMDAFDVQSSAAARKRSLILLKQERIMKEITKSVEDIATKLGIDHEYILSKFKGLADVSEDEDIIFKAVRELSKIIGTQSQSVKRLEGGIFGIFQDEITPEQLEEAKRPMLEEREVKDERS